MRKTPPKDELLHLFRIRMRKSEKLKIHFMEFERLREDHPRKTYKYLFTLARRCCAQRRRDDVSAQYRSQSSPPANRGLAAKAGGAGNQTGICRDWRKIGRCANQANCPWRHPEDVRGTGKGKGKGKANVRAKAKAKEKAKARAKVKEKVKG